MKQFNQLSCLVGLAVLALAAPSLGQDTGLPLTTPPSHLTTPAHMWEFGLHGGLGAALADAKFEPGWGAGFHLRRAIDYVFSVRSEGLVGQLKFNDPEDGIAETNFQSGTLQMVISLNNLIWNDRPKRKSNLYGFVGGGLTRFEVKAKAFAGGYLQSYGPKVQTHADLGIGIALRVTDRFNLGFEAKGQAIFGRDADRLDGVARQNNDVIAYLNTRLNFNLGRQGRRMEPLYWVNPMDMIMQDVSELKNRPKFDLTDTDGDGVIDLIDQDNTTLPGVSVDTRGRALDSDNDGIPNYEDEAPYLPRGSQQPPGQDGEKPFTTPEDMTKIVEGELRKYESQGGNLTDWFLPIIHFGIDSYKIRYADYGNLASIAKVLKSHADLRIVVTGFTDKTASTEYNANLSYRRAQATIEHLVNVHGIARSRLILNFNGEDAPLVPSAGSTLMNRRVEFRAAQKDDVDVESPVPVSKKSSKRGSF